MFPTGRCDRSRAIAPIAVLAFAFLTLLALLPQSASALGPWPPTKCTTPGPIIAWPSSSQCIGAKTFQARGRINPACVTTPPLWKQVYPATTSCWGNGAEYIAQARLIAKLGSTFGGIATSTQWEVQIRHANGLAEGRPDITYDAGTALNVYEAKQTSDPRWWRTAIQVDEYVAAFNAVKVNPIARRGPVTGTNIPVGWSDQFMTPQPGNPKCTKDGQEHVLMRLFSSFLIGPGILAVWHQDLPCFRLNEERVPVTENVQVDVPVKPGETPKKEPVPLGGITIDPGGWTPVPGTSIPTPDDPGGSDAFPSPVPAPATNPVPPGKGGGAHGDPHMTSLDGLAFDLMSAGEFYLVQSDDFEIQARFVPISTSFSIVGRVAFTLDGHVVEVDARNDKLRIDGELYTLAEGKMLDFGDGATVRRYDYSFFATWPNDVALQVRGGLLRVYVPPGIKTSGLLGSSDGNASNDLKVNGGEQLPANSTATTLHGTFADSWRISDDESLFTYAEGESTETFTDRAFPTNVVSLGDLSDSVIAAATAACADAGVADGRVFDDCVYDWALTQDQQFLDAAADVTVARSEGGARGVAADGKVSEAFETTTVAPNFSSVRYSSGASTGKFADPFGRDGRYSFYVPALPGHTSATVGFNLIALGNWTNSSTSPVTVTVDGATAWTGDLGTRSPSATGTTPEGQAYRVYPMSLPVPHSADQLNVGVWGAFAPGEARAIGVDDINVALSLVPPQQFTVTLPASISDGVPAAGTGKLETTGSQDSYSFSLATAGEVQVDVSSCSGSLGDGLRWTITDTAAAVKAEGTCASSLTPSLPPATYKLNVMARGKTGTYRLAALRRPAVQRFAVTLPASVTNGVPSTGAGNLETTASEDDYAFSVPTPRGVLIDFAGCSTTLGNVSWKLVNDSTHAVIASQPGTCGSTIVPNVAAGQYRLEVSSNGRTGTYSLSLMLQPPPQVFSLGSSASISDGVPGTGAGNLETTGSEDHYEFTTTRTGGVQMNFSDCAASLGYITWKLVNATTGATEVPTNLGCDPEWRADVPAGQHRLIVSRNGYKGTYKLAFLIEPLPDMLDVTLPAQIAPGQPAVGAGNLETTASTDVYGFTTPVAMGMQLDFANCSSSLNGGVDWKLIDADSGTVKQQGSGCGPTLVPNFPAGRYELRVSRLNRTGTYELTISPRPDPDVFTLTSSATVSDGVPGPGAGNLETTASEDHYEFTTTRTGGVQMNFSDCAASLGYITWKLVNATTGAIEVPTNLGCDPEWRADVPAGQHRLIVSRNGYKGTYKLAFLIQPLPDTFDVALPAQIGPGQPGAGAGNLETTASNDVYGFTTSEAGGVQVEPSNCSSSLNGGVDWKLIDADTGAVKHQATSCGATLVPDIPAGRYTVDVSRLNRTGTYSLALSVRPRPDVFTLTSPATVSDGVPGRVPAIWRQRPPRTTTSSRRPRPAVSR